MNSRDPIYAKHALVRDMLETAVVIASFDPGAARPFVAAVKKKKALFFTGEGSSRIFPAGQAMAAALRRGGGPRLAGEGARQAMEYDLSGFAVFAASNSGRTREVVRLLEKLKRRGHEAFFGLTANHDTPLEALALKTHLLGCGKEAAVAATKSVVEQALFYQALLGGLAGRKMTGLAKAGRAFEQVLTMPIDTALVEKLGRAGTIYFAGRNDGAAEELRLKTNEITRKKSDYLEGTYAVHGVEEVMRAGEVVVVIEPFPDEEAKLRECLVEGAGLTVVAIAARPTGFPTILIPDGGAYRGCLELAAGWNLLVEIGTLLGVDLDHPLRARKVGNEVASS